MNSKANYAFIKAVNPPFIFKLSYYISIVTILNQSVPYIWYDLGAVSKIEYMDWYIHYFESNK